MDKTESTTLPTRRFIDPSISLHTSHLDKHGFLKDTLSVNTSQVKDLFAKTPTLIVAPPWTGKSYIAKQIKLSLDTGKQLDVYGKFYISYDLEQSGFALQPPPWWQEWKKAKTPCAIIIDSVDEGARSDNRALKSLVDEFENLTAKQLRRLKIILFCRENERDRAIEDRLRLIFSNKLQEFNGIHLAKLAPLTVSEAKRIIDDDENFEKICKIIEKNNLQSIAGLPNVLIALNSFTSQDIIDVPAVWKRVLENTLSDRHVTDVYLDTRFQAVSKIAASMLLSAKEYIGDGIMPSPNPTVSDIFPNQRDAASRVLRTAAGVALRSAVFISDSNGYRFAQKHVQEWFATFAIKSIDANRLRGLLVDSDGVVYTDCLGLIANLLKCCTESQRVFLQRLFPGLPPKSDTAPWTLDEVKLLIQNILQYAEDSPYPLYFWSEEADFSQLSVEGLGDYLVDLAKEEQFSDIQKQLIVRIASATSSVNFSDAAFELLVDEEKSIGLRESCAYFIRKYVTEPQLDKLDLLAKNYSTKNDEEASLLSVIIDLLYSNGKWSHHEACEALPSKTGNVGDATTSLYHTLSSDLTRDNARQLLKQSDLNSWALSIGEYGRQKWLDPKLGVVALYDEAVCQLVKDGIQAEDLGILLPCAVNKIFVGDNNIFVTEIFQQTSQGRRLLFKWRLENTSEEVPYPYPHYITTEDLGWLKDAIIDFGEKNEWVLEFSVNAVRTEKIDRANTIQVRKLVKSINPTLIESMDRAFRNSQRRMKKFDEERYKPQKHEVERYHLSQVIASRLSKNDWESGNLMRELSSLCFPPGGMSYSNVDGKWEDLEASQQQKVFEAIAKGLDDGEPMGIEDGRQYKAGILFEANAFVKAVNESPPGFEMKEDYVHKWLPSVLVAGSPPDEKVILECISASAELFINTIINELRRIIRSAEDRIYFLENLPAAAWKTDLGKHVVDLLTDDSLLPKIRSELLKVVTKNNPTLAKPYVEQWIKLKWTKANAGLILTALDAYCMINLEEAVHAIDKAIQQKLPVDLADIQSLSNHGWGAWEAGIEKISAKDIALLYRLVRDQYPPSEDPERSGGEAYTPTDHDRMARLRNHLLNILYSDVHANKHLLNELGHAYSDLKETTKYYLAHRSITDAVKGGASPPGSHSQLQDVVAVLDNSDYWVIRDGYDLHLLITSELNLIGENANYHLSMLYERPPAKKSTSSSSSTTKTKPRRRLLEDSLQAYIKCRLEDRLHSRTSNRSFSVTAVRESKVSYGQFLDIQCFANTFDGKSVCVIIEVKWSDNAEVSTALSEQLGTRYLLNQNYKFGVYLVGVTDLEKYVVWKDPIAPKNKKRIASWRDALDKQSERFMGDNDGISISVVLWDLRLRSSRTRKKTKPKPKK